MNIDNVSNKDLDKASEEELTNEKNKQAEKENGGFPAGTYNESSTGGEGSILADDIDKKSEEMKKEK